MAQIIEMLQKSCLQHAQKPALRSKVAGRWIDCDYATLWEDSNRIAAGLADWGIEPGERAAILAPSSPTWVITYLGILKSNAIAVPIDKELKRGELRHILSDCGARILFTETAYQETILDLAESLPALEKVVILNPPPSHPGDLSPEAENALSALVVEWHRLAREYQLRQEDIKNFENLAEGFQHLVLPARVSADEEKKNLIKRLLHTREGDASPYDIVSLQTFQKSATPPALTSHADDPAVILYTSGTTGRSKGAMLSHANISSNVTTAIDLFRLESSMHTLSFLPINHVFEQVAGILLPLTVGGTVTFAESLRKLGDNLSEVKPNFLLGVPAVFRLLADRMSRKIDSRTVSRTLFRFAPTRSLVVKKIREAFGGSPVFVSGGAALDPGVATQLMELGLQVYQGYGITETSPVIAVETPECKRLGTVGKPIPGVQVKIDRPNAEGVGEIWVKGPNVMLGYYHNQAATNEVITDGWYHTGDLGYLEEDGYLRICGRVKNLIVTANGKNVYPEEVENEIAHSPFIAEIMVYGHKVDATSEEVYAMIYPDQEALDRYAAEQDRGPFSMTDVEEIIRREVLERGKNLADYKRIKRFTLREDEFPKTTTRKIKRFAVEADIDTSGEEPS
ncbi:MAG: AMP-binding protein [Desulfuromonadales bacterium]